MMRTEIARVVKEMVAKKSGTTPDQIDDSFNLDELDIDGIIKTEILMSCETTLGFEIPVDRFDEIHSIKDAIDQFVEHNPNH